MVKEVAHCPFGTFITVEISCSSWFSSIYLTVAYVPSDRKKRIEWITNSLSAIPITEHNLIIGDFNFVEKPSDRIGGSPGGGMHGAKEFSSWTDLND